MIIIRIQICDAQPYMCYKSNAQYRKYFLFNSFNVMNAPNE